MNTQKMQLQKDLLFYSNLCDHCKDVINTINKKNIRDSFMFVCVDNPKFVIPEFIKVVPSILTIKKQIFINKVLYDYLESKSTHTINTIEEISPFTIGSANYSTSYTWLSTDGNGYDNDGMLLNNEAKNNNFVLLNDNLSLNAPKENNTDNKSNKFDSSIYEKYINSRTNDDEHIKKILDTDSGSRYMR
jgi:hypothetical protein